MWCTNKLRREVTSHHITVKYGASLQEMWCTNKLRREVTPHHITAKYGASLQEMIPQFLFTLLLAVREKDFGVLLCHFSVVLYCRTGYDPHVSPQGRGNEHLQSRCISQPNTALYLFITGPRLTMVHFQMTGVMNKLTKLLHHTQISPCPYNGRVSVERCPVVCLCVCHSASCV